MRFIFCLICALVVSGFDSLANAEGAPATYQRRSRGAMHGRHMAGWQHPGFGYGWATGWGGFYNQAFAGSWYQRPYPYHFDYYKNRFNGPPAGMMPPLYPCVEPTIAE